MAESDESDAAVPEGPSASTPDAKSEQGEQSAPDTSEPVASEAVASEPATSEPVASEPVASEPATSEPAADEPVTSAPAPTSGFGPAPQVAGLSPGVVTYRLVASVFGVAAGALGFIGFFLDFFSRSGTSLSSASSGWFDLVPIFLGIATLAILVPRYAFAASGLGLGSLGIAFGIHGLAAGLASQVSRAQGATLGYGIGFWCIVIGSGVLSLAWVALLAERIRPLDR